MNALRIDYLRLLETWVPSISPHLHAPKERPDLLYYGDGTNGWGMQTTQKAMGALAVLATEPELNEKRIGLSRPQLLDRVRAMLRYTLDTHLSGCFHTTDSDDFRWGHTWISALGIERMMPGVEAIWDQLTPEDHTNLRKMLISESEWLLSDYKVVADPVSPNHPESNMWNGAMLWRTALYYPDAPQAEAFREKGTQFLLNAISIPSDKTSKRLFDSRPLSDWHIGANFFESYACNHHGYLNIGYMVITLSNLALLHFTCRHLGMKAPEALYLHMEKLWQMVRMSIFDDGRLNRIGGDTRVRYCYCQDYLLPVLMLAADALGDDCRALERGWLQQLQTEIEHNGDGTFLSTRCELFVERSPLYFTRLESDRAITLAYEVLWRRLYNDFTTPHGTGDYQLDPSFRKPLTSWHDDYHGSCYIRDPKRLASFTWRASEWPQGLCLPPDESTLAEWRMNMVSDVLGDGAENSRELIEHHETMFPGGFITAGRFTSTTKGLLAEQINQEETALTTLAFAALPDGATIVTLQFVQALKHVHLNTVKGLKLNIPNDIFNHFKREYRRAGPTLTIDEKLTVTALHGGTLTIVQAPHRQIGLREKQVWFPERGMLHVDEICIGLEAKPRWYEKDETILDFGAAVTIGTSPPTGHVLNLDNNMLRGVSVTGQDGCDYRIIVNIGDKTETTEGLSLAPATAQVLGI